MEHDVSIPVGSYVELKEGREDVYLLAQAGSRAWVRDHRADSMGFMMVFVEWDSEHWTWNGEEDGWTFESHWRVLESPKEEEESFVSRVLEKVKQSKEECPTCGHESDPEGDKRQLFLESLMEGVEEAMASDGFFLITVKPITDAENGVTIYAPQLFGEALTDESTKMLEAQMVHLASKILNDFTLELAERIGKDKK
jgi:hypothetical protein